MADFNDTPLGEQDAILSEDVEKRLSEYLSSPQNSRFSAGEHLASNYIGIPDIIRKLLNWSSIFSNDPNSVLRQATEASLIELEPRLIPQLNHALTTSDFSIPGIDAICASSTWRPFFTAMAERHQTSVLANAIKRQQVLSSAHVNKSSFSNPEAFCAEFENLIISSLSADSSPSTTGTKQFLSRFSALCAYDECTSKSALYTLDRLSQTAHEPLTRCAARRLAQFVRQESIKQIRSIGRAPPAVAALPAQPINEEEAELHIARQSILTKCVAYDCQMRPDIVDSLITVALSKSDVGDFRTAVNIEKEIAMVTNSYACLLVGTVTSAGQPIGDKQALPFELRVNPVTFHEKAVYIRVVCDELILGPLLQAAFSVKRRPSPSDALHPKKKRVLCLLLAFAHTFLKIDDETLLARLRDRDETRNLCSDVSKMFQDIELFVSICETLKPGCATYQIKEVMDTLIKVNKDPFLTRGLLIWATEGLLGGSNLRDLRRTAVIHLAFLAMIADDHSALRPGVVDAIRQAMVRNYGDLEDMEIAEIKQNIMRCISGLIRSGLGLELVELFLDHLVDSEAIDIAHLRSFLSQLLTISTPPYSDEFVASVLKLINCDRLKAALSVNRYSENNLREIVNEFKQQIGQTVIS